MHRDIKPQNIICISNDEIKLIDFGLSDTTDHSLVDFAGTLIYVAPEVFTNNYNNKCDIWSCGVIMYQLISGQLPF